MYKVLVVEDEAIIRQGLIQTIQWEALGLTLAAEAENGAQALEFLSQMPIDIIITDMRMPVCDGPSMLREIEGRKLDCEIIVLSEYTDFAYMRQAIHAHVFDYLLKPVTSENLNKLLAKVVHKLENKSARNTSTNQLDQLFYTLTNFSPAQFQELYVKYKEAFSGKGIILCCIQLQTKVRKDSHLDSLLKKNIQTCPYESRLLSYGENQKQSCILSLLPSSTSLSEAAYRSWLGNLLQQLQTVTAARMGLSSPKASLEALPEALIEAKACLQFLRKNKNILYYKEVKKLSISQQPLPINEHQLTELLSGGKEVRTELFRTILYALEQEEYLYLPSLKHMLSVFTLLLERCCQTVGKSVNISSLIGASYLDKINQLEWYGEITAFLQDMLDKTFSALEEQNTSSTENVLRHVLHAVQTEYMKDLSLISFSQKYHINYIYLSRRFKEYTGETFTNYLMQVRMEKARQFIEQDGFSEKDTAALVGYSNPYYFISSYHKYFNQEDTKNEKN